MKILGIAAILFCVIFSFGGCKEQEVRAPAVVTKVQIRCIHNDEQICRSYTQEEEIRAVLDCLRLQRSKGTAQVDPERVMGDVFEIQIGMSDGAQHIYRHRGGQYLSKDSGPWQTVSREHGTALYELLWQRS